MIEHPEYCYSQHDKEMYVLEVLAYSMYDTLIVANRKNVIAFIYECLKADAKDLQDYAEKEEHEHISLVESISMTLDNLYADRYVSSLRDYMCRSTIDKYIPIYCKPIIYSYDPTYDYTQRA